MIARFADAPPVDGRRRLVLVGAGHAHAQVLQSFAQHPISDIDIVVISPTTQAPYSGMMPAWLAGDHDWQDCCIDFDRLCQRVGARLIVDSVVRIDLDAKMLVLESGMRVAYAWLSINIGSTLHAPAVASASSATGKAVQEIPMRVIPMRPLSALCERWQIVLDDLERHPPGARYKVVMIGGGAAGIESILSVHHRLKTLKPGLAFQFTLATQGQILVPGLSSAAGKILQAHLHQRGIEVKTGFAAKHISSEAVLGNSGQSISADVVLWATGAQAFGWPAASGLATTAEGFIRIDTQLRSISHPEVFATGDCAAWEVPLPKAGVYAVRMGPVLAQNLRTSIDHAPLVSYRPQRRYLALVGTGARHAVASWGPLGWQGAWVYVWKQRIDRHFLARYNHV